MDVVAIWINCPDAVVADAIAEELLRRRLAACANRYPAIASRYHWKGRMESTVEVPLLVKTRAALFDAVAAAARELHPYDCPAIWASSFAAVTPDYRDWILSETAGAA
jgi:periplasmic divalent cation tolerance protein